MSLIWWSWKRSKREIKKNSLSIQTTYSKFYLGIWLLDTKLSKHTMYDLYSCKTMSQFTIQRRRNCDCVNIESRSWNDSLQALIWISRNESERTVNSKCVVTFVSLRMKRRCLKPHLKNETDWSATKSTFDESALWESDVRSPLKIENFSRNIKFHIDH
jgi:hypothetical protein